MRKKKNILNFASKKDQYTFIPNFKVEKKIDINFVFSTKNETKKLIIS